MSSAALLDVTAVTAVGRTATASAAAFRASLSGFSLRWSPRVAGDEAFTIADVTDLPRFEVDAGDASAAPRMAALAALAASQLTAVAAASGPVFLGVPSPRPGFVDGASGLVVEHATQALRARGFAPTVVEVVALDHAAGFAALERAMRVLDAREAEVCVVGGVDSYLAGDTLAWLHAREQLKSRHNRWGFVAGEGAGMLVVASAGFAAARGLRARAQVVAVGRGHEPVAPRTAEPQTGVGLTAALRATLGALPDGARVDDVLSDQNGERWRGDELGFAMPRVVERLAAPRRLLTPASAFGDVGAASGPLQVAVALHLAERGAARGPTVLALTSADGSERAAALLSVPVCERE